MLSLAAVNATALTRPTGHSSYRAPCNAVTDRNGQVEFGGTHVAFARNAQFYGEGDSSIYLYKLTSGLARSYRIRPDGRRQIVAFYVPGDLFGFEFSDIHTLSVEAITEARAHLIKRATIMNIASRDEEIARQLWSYAGREIRRNQDHILQLSESARAAVASFLLEMGRRIPGADAVVLPIPRQDIADYLDLRLETVSRTMTRIAKSGAIALNDKRKITIRNRSILSQLAS